MLFVTLRLLVGLLLRFCCAPGICAVVGFLPSGARVLVDVAVMPGIHVAAGGPTHCSMRRAVTTKELSKVSGTASFPDKFVRLITTRTDKLFSALTVLTVPERGLWLLA